MNKLFFYHKKVEPKKCRYYNHSIGIAGYQSPQSDNGEVLIYGTPSELDHYLKTRKRPARDRRE